MGLKASRNTFQQSLNRHNYLTNWNPPIVKTRTLTAAQLQEHLAKTARQDETANNRTHADKVYLGL